MKHILFIIIVNILIHNCRAQRQNNYQLQELDSGASCIDYNIVNNSNKVQLNKEIQNALQCPSVIGLQRNFLYFSSQGKINQYNLETKNSKTLFTLYADIDGIDGPFWSPDKSRMAFTIVNQSLNHGYTNYVRVIVYDINEKGELFNKQKFDIGAYFICGSRCSSKIEFLDNHTFQYRDIMDKGGDIDIVNYKTRKIK